ncbi:APC amino acid permease [Cyathus striatus]|nr:APC amino acid permease [Cyathus striatus]
MLQEITSKTSEVVPVDQDELLLASLGYKQEFKRNFTPLEVFGVGFSIIGLVPSIASVLVYSIPYGGPSAMIWGWTACSIFLAVIALAIAELGSMAPTSGGLYYWTFMFSSHKWRCLLSWIVGYSNTVGNIAGVASLDWGCAVQIMAAVSIGSGLTFQPTAAQTFGVYCALLLCHAIICSLNPIVIARLQIPYIIINILLCLAIIIGVPTATPKEFINSAGYVFGNFTNISGWTNGYAFILSFLSPLWAIGAFDSTIHISEEASNASIAIPYAIIFAAMSGIILGWGLNVTLAFCMGNNLGDILESPIEQPMATILFNSFGQKGTLAIWAFIVVIQFTMTTSLLTSCSRQVFAFSRDGALPFSKWLYRIHPKTHAPVNCVWFTTVLSGLFGLLAFAGPAAIGAIFSIAVASQYIVYSIPISARYLGGKDLRPGPFRLGILSKPVAAVAVTWMVFIIIVFFFPATPNPEASNMNYTVVVLGGTVVLSIIYYYFPKYGGVHWFKGPIANVDVSESRATNDSEQDVTDKS